jgi:hypothetical protein
VREQEWVRQRESEKEIIEKNSNRAREV